MGNERRQTKNRLVLANVLLACGATVALARLGVAAAQGPGAVGGPLGPPGPFGGRGGPMMEEQKIVERFDKNNDNRLDSTECQAAREWLTTNGGGRRGFGGRGFALNPSSPGPRLSPVDARTYGSEPLYDLETVRTVFLQFENSDWEQELAAFNNTDVEVPATVIIDGKTYKDVGVHFRGASSFFMVPEGSKRSLNLSFDFVHQGQQVGGYRTLNLLNGNGDPTFVRAVLYSEIARDYLPAPKTNFMRVVINGESWGPYINAQQYNRDFLRDFFKTEESARWKVPGRPGGRGGMEYLGDDPAVYKATYEIKTKDDPKVWASLIEMFRILNQTPPEQLEAALSPLLDIDGALRFLAVEMALVNSDGYWARASDYNIYRDPNGMFHVIPHDMNEGMNDGLLNEGMGRGRGRGPGPPPGVGPGVPPQGEPVVIPLPPGVAGEPGPSPNVLQSRGRGRGFTPFGGGPELDPLTGLDDPSKPLRSKLLAVPSLSATYLAYVRDIAERWLDWQKLEPKLRGYRSVIAEDVKADTKRLYSYEAFESGFSGGESSLQSFAQKRRTYLLNVTAPGSEMK